MGGGFPRLGPGVQPPDSDVHVLSPDQREDVRAPVSSPTEDVRGRQVPLILNKVKVKS